MSKKLQIVMMVLVIIAMVLWITTELLPKAGQQVWDTVQNVQTETKEAALTGRYISFMKSDQRVAAILAECKSSNVLSYELLTLNADNTANGAIRYLGQTDNKEHEIVLYLFTAESGVDMQTLLLIDGLQYVFTPESGLEFVR